MLRFIVDWVGRVGGFSQVEEILIQQHDTLPPPIVHVEIPPDPPTLEIVERRLDDAAHPTPQQLGIRFQRREFRKLLNAVGHWQSIEFLTANGARIETMDDVPRGADGGIDVVIRIVTDTERGARAIGTRIRNMIVRQSY